MGSKVWWHQGKCFLFIFCYLMQFKIWLESLTEKLTWKNVSVFVLSHRLCKKTFTFDYRDLTIVQNIKYCFFCPHKMLKHLHWIWICSFTKCKMPHSANKFTKATTDFSFSKLSISDKLIILVCCWQSTNVKRWAPNITTQQITNHNHKASKNIKKKTQQTIIQ